MLDHMGLKARASRPEAHNSPALAKLPEALSLEVTSRRPLELNEETARYILRRPIPAVAAPAAAPVASVVVPVLENLACTRLALESLLANTGQPPYELVVVDNGSAAPTRKYLEVLAARNRHVRVVRNDRNVGFAAGCNQGFAAARGEILVLLDDDVIVTPDWLPDLVARLDDPSNGLVGPATNRCRGMAQVPTSYTTYGDMVRFARRRREELTGDDVRDVDVSDMFCVAFPRSVFEAIGPLDEQLEIGMFEDDYARRARDAGHRVVCAPEVFTHRFDESSLGSLDDQPAPTYELQEPSDQTGDEERTA
jgi:GT2 family glycosyltransferase